MKNTVKPNQEVLTPNNLPVIPGKKIGEYSVEEIGTPLFSWYRTEAIVPVRFRGNTHGLVRCSIDHTELFTPRSNEAQGLITNSTKMPIIRNGVGGDVWHIVVYENNKNVLIKSYFNFKADYPDRIYR